MSESEKDKTKTTVRIEKDKTLSKLVYLRETASDLAKKWRDAKTIEGEVDEISELNHASERVFLALSVIEHAPAIELVRLARELRKVYMRGDLPEAAEVEGILTRIVKAVERIDGIH